MRNSQLWAEINVKLTVMARFLTLISTTMFFSSGNKCENWPISVETPELPIPGRHRCTVFADFTWTCPPSLQYERDFLRLPPPRRGCFFSLRDVGADVREDPNPEKTVRLIKTVKLNPLAMSRYVALCLSPSTSCYVSCGRARQCVSLPYNCVGTRGH